MLKSKVSSEGNIKVRFPPPVAKGLGAELRWAIKGLLGNEGSCSAFDTAFLGGPPGWCISVTIKKPAATAGWAARLMDFFREQDISPDAVMEVSLMRGALEIDVQNLETSLLDLKRVLFRDTRPVSASLLMEIAGPVEDFEAMTAQITRSVTGYAVVRNAYQGLGTATVSLSVGEARHLTACIMTLSGVLKPLVSGERVRLAVSTQLHQETLSLFPGNPEAV